MSVCRAFFTFKGGVAGYLQHNIIIRVFQIRSTIACLCKKKKKKKLVNANSSLPVGVADASWLTKQHQHPHTQREWVFGVKVWIIMKCHHSSFIDLRL